MQEDASRSTSASLRRLVPRCDHRATRLQVLASGEGAKTLTVVNVNRTSVERALGVDLLHYNHTYRSFVLVQYMEDEDGGRKSGLPTRWVAAC